MASIGPPPPGGNEPEGLKRAREAEDIRYNPKRRRVGGLDLDAEKATQFLQEAAPDIARFREQIKTWSDDYLFHDGYIGDQKARVDMIDRAPKGMWIPAIHMVIEEERQTRREQGKLNETKRFIMEIKRMPLGNPGQGVKRDTVRELARRSRDGEQEYLSRHGYKYLTPEIIHQIPEYVERLRELTELLRGTVDMAEQARQAERKRLANEIKTWPIDGERPDMQEWLEGHGYQYIDEIEGMDLDEWKEWDHDWMSHDLAQKLTTPAYYDFVINWPPAQHQLQMLQDEVEDVLSLDEVRELLRREREQRGLSSSGAAPAPGAPAPPSSSSTFGIGGRYHRRRKCLCS